jgi:hypothetical protein
MQILELFCAPDPELRTQDFSPRIIVISEKLGVAHLVKKTNTCFWYGRLDGRLHKSPPLLKDPTKPEILCEVS